MLIRKFVFLLLVMAVGVSALLLCYGGVKQHPVIPRPPLDERDYRSQGKLQQRKVPKPYGKITVPANVFVDLASTSNPGGPVTILVHASSQIPVSSGILTLKVPPIGEFPAETEVIWSEAPSDFIAETVEYTMDNLPAGKYRFIAIFEFTPDGKNAEKLFTSKSLYLDVRPSTILSSNVSFNQIKRVELWKELKQRVLMDLKAGSTAIGPKTVARDINTTEILNPDILASRIAELKASDPEIARRIMELNRVKPVPTGESESIRQGEESLPNVMLRSIHNRPVMEREVPIPDRYRDL